MINWPLVILLTVICVPGVLTAIPRVINFLVGEEAESVVRARLALLAKIQTMLMVFIMAIAGSVLSRKTGLSAPVFQDLIDGKPIGHEVLQYLFPVFIISVVTTAVFFLLYYSIFAKRLPASTVDCMKRLRKSLSLDGCVLYGGIVEEVLVRWGLMNLIVFFAALFSGKVTNTSIYLGIVISSLFFSVGHLPTYFAAGCEKSRFFAFAVLVLNLTVSIAFSYLFWQYGLLAAMIGHASLHVIWWYYD